MSEIIDLPGRPKVPLEDDELIENLARYADGTLTCAQVKSRHHLTDEDWTALGEIDRFVELVEARKLFRLRSGATKRERAQIEIIDAPPILGKLMRSPDSNARHVIDAVKALDSLATPEPQTGAAASDRFVITIVMNDQTLHFDKSIAIDASDGDHSSTDTPLAAIAANKSKDDDDGQGYF